MQVAFRRVRHKTAPTKEVRKFYTDSPYFTMTNRRVCWKVGVVNW